MAPVIRVPPDDLRMIANDIRVTGGQFAADTPPPVDSDPDWPSTGATSDFNHGVHSTNQKFQQHSQDTGDKVHTAADAFQATDEGNAQQLYAIGQQMGTQSSGLKPNEISSIFTGIVKDIGTAASGIANSLITGFASASGALGGAAASSLGALSSAGANIGATMAKSNVDLHPPAAAPSVGAGVSAPSGDKERPAQTTPTAGVSSTALSTTPEGGRPIGEHQEAHAPTATAGSMGGGMPAGLMGPGGGSSSSVKAKTYKVATTATDYSDDEPITAPIPVVQVSVPPIEKAV